MRIRVLSDLHLEFHRRPEKAKIFDDVACDVVVLAGDIHNGVKGIEWAARTIRQDQADAAPYFIDALELFRDEFGIRGGAQPRFASWGNYDRNALLDECAYRNVEYPFRDDNHVNLKAEAVKALGLKRRMGLSRTLEAIGLAFEGRPHAGVDDAWNIGRVVMEMFRRGWKPPVKRPGS